MADNVLEMMHTNGVVVDRENYIALNWGADRREPWAVEDEDQLPPRLQNWSLFEMRGDEMVYIGK